MGIIKLIAILVVVWLLFSLFRKFNKPASSLGKKPSSSRMLACSVCDMRIPENEAIIKNGRIYCSKKHLEQD